VIWSPVPLVLGVWCYFSLTNEPSWLTIAVFVPALLACMALLLRHGGGTLLAVVSLVLAGFMLAKLQVWRADTTLLPASTGKVAISGIVESVERRAGTAATLVLSVTRLNAVPAENRPERVRLIVNRYRDDILPGVTITGSAYLRPLPVPAIPGGFDFGRQLFLKGIGATGSMPGEIVISEDKASWRYLVERELSQLRSAIGGRIAAALPGGQGGFAQALITGERGGIPRPINESLQISGLAHILSISGLHMSLVAGGVFWLVRALLAASPYLALRYPIKKWAAAAALFAGFFYMLLAGADVATQRSYIMLGVVFAAIIFDRPAISMRNLAIAALIILFTQPAAAITASFQMSFMAVMGLAAFYDAYSSWRANRLERMQQSWLRRWLRLFMMGLFATAATTLVAGSLSSIPAAHHFGRLSPLSLLTNMLALPVVSFVVMPAATLSVVVMPLGLEAVPLWVMGQGLQLVVQISDWVVGLPAARADIPLLPGLAAAVLAGGAIWICLWQGSLRVAGLALIPAALLLSQWDFRPDILVEARAANVAIRNSDKVLVPAERRKGSFSVEKWLQAEGDGLGTAGSSTRNGWTCRASECRAVVRGYSVVYLRSEGDPQQACRGAEIVIAAFPLRGNCKGAVVRIDRFDVWRKGAHALYVSERGIQIRTSRQMQGERPWTVVPISRRELLEPVAPGATTQSHTQSEQKSEPEDSNSSEDDGGSQGSD
jgi:competence protein ComEC